MEPRDLTGGIARQPHCEHEAFEAQCGNLVLGLMNVGPIAFLYVRRSVVLTGKVLFPGTLSQGGGIFLPG